MATRKITKDIFKCNLFSQLLVIGFFVGLAIIGNRVGIVQLATLGYQGVPASYSTNIVQALANPSTQIEILPGLILAQILSLPPYSVEFFFFLLYHAASGIFMYFFIYRYLGLVTGSERIPFRLAISIGGGLIFMYFPYNLFGDNFPELFFMRSFIPLFFLLIMEFMESKKIILLALSSVLLGYMTILDPRALIFIPTLTLFFLVIPKTVISSVIRSKIVVISSFIFCVMLSFLISSFTVTPRLTAIPVSTSIGVPFVKEAFRYSYSNMLNTLGGLSFEGTFQASAFLPFGVSYCLIIGLMMAIVAFSVILTIRFRERRFGVYVFIPTFFVLAVLAVFVGFGGPPLFQSLLFSGYPPSLSSAVKTVGLLFRTTRFTNMMLSLVYSIFSCLAISFFVKFIMLKEKALRFFNQNEYQVIVVNWKIFSKKIFGRVFTVLFLITIISNVVIFTSSGSVLGDFTGERANAYSEVNRIYGNNQFSIITVPYSNTLWDFPQPLVAPSESVMRYIYSYALDPSLQTSLLSRNQTSQLGILLSMAGIKYLVSDGYVGNQTNVINTLNHSSSLTYSGRVGQLSIFRVKNFENITIGNPVLVLGGLETYFKTIETLKLFSINTSFAPIFMDGPLNGKTDDFESLGPILSSPNKSIFDLMGSFFVNDRDAIVIPPSMFTINHDPSNYWSPAFVSDTHQGVWTYYLGQLVGYDWDYSYSPSYGIALTWGPATLGLNFQLNKTGTYSVFMRSLHHPENGTVRIGLDSNETILNTRWNSSATEFVWDCISDVILKKGLHTLSISNEEGLNAVNLVVIIPSEKVGQLGSVAEQLYSYKGDVRIPNRVTISNNTSTSRVENYSMNVIGQGNYSAVIHLNVDRPLSNSAQLVINNNQTYRTQVLSLDPYVVHVDDIALPSGNQSMKLVSSQPFNASDITTIVYGPKGSLVDNLFSGVQNESQVIARNLSINQVRPGYYEQSITFDANSSFMLVLTQLYSGTMKVSFDPQSSNVTYSTYPISDVFTGIWFRVPNESLPISFTATFFTEEDRALKQSNENAILLATALLLVAVAIDVAFIRYKKIKQHAKLKSN